MDLADRDVFDLSVRDDDHREEVALTAKLIVAASESTTAMAQDEVDRILGVSPGRGPRLT